MYNICVISLEYIKKVSLLRVSQSQSDSVWLILIQSDSVRCIWRYHIDITLGHSKLTKSSYEISMESAWNDNGSCELHGFISISWVHQCVLYWIWVECHMKMDMWNMRMPHPLFEDWMSWPWYNVRTFLSWESETGTETNSNRRLYFSHISPVLLLQACNALQ